MRYLASTQDSRDESNIFLSAEIVDSEIVQIWQQRVGHNAFRFKSRAIIRSIKYIQIKLRSRKIRTDTQTRELDSREMNMLTIADPIAEPDWSQDSWVHIAADPVARRRRGPAARVECNRDKSYN